MKGIFQRFTRPGMRSALAGWFSGVAIAAAVAVALTAPAEAQDAESPRYGGTLIVGLAAEPASLNIALTTNLPESMVTAGIYSKLVRLGIEEEFLPELAESWDISEDGLTYTFHLRDGVTWHDGEAFTSSDVAYSLVNLTQKFHPNGNMMEPVTSIETPDDTTVVITLAHPSEPFLTFLGLRAYILPQHIYEGTDIRENPANVRPIGTGPFKFSEWDRGSHIELVANPDYFLPEMPYLDRMVFRIIPDPSSRILALETGEVDYLTHDIPSTSLEALRKNPDVTLTDEGVSLIVSIGQIMFNQDREPFDDPKVRRALTVALDRDFIADRATLGAFKRADGPIHSSTGWAYDADALTVQPHDPALAARLLDEAGLTVGDNGKRFSMELLAPRGRDDQVRASEIVAQVYRELGIEVTTGILDNSALSEVSYVNRNYDAMINTLSVGPDPAVGVARQYVCSNIRPVPFTNASGYCKEEVDALFEAGAVATTRAERAAAYSEAQRILSEDVAVSWLWEVTPYSAYRNEFANIHNDSSAANYYLYSAWWREGSESR